MDFLFWCVFPKRDCEGHGVRLGASRRRRVGGLLLPTLHSDCAVMSQLTAIEKVFRNVWVRFIVPRARSRIKIVRGGDCRKFQEMHLADASLI